MKRNISLIFAVAVLAIGCNKDPDPVSKVVDVTYPTITLKGPAIVHIPVNGTFTDDGATLTDDVTGAVSDISATVNEIDATTEGIYAVRYIASNANGFKTEVVRTVLVKDYTPPANLDPNFDISGTWVRTNGIVNNVVKIDNGLYVMDNFAGSTAVYPAYMVTPDTTSFDIPEQTAFGLHLECTNETILSSNPFTVKYIVSASGFGTQFRTFIKQ
ncbi:MAG: hypothetical protein RL213_748 [Bacteroidota bacterium]|jgi:hypothetical protein